MEGLGHLLAKGQSEILTEALGQKVLDELSVVANVQHGVDAGVHQVLLLVAQILADVLGDKHDVSLHVDHEEEAVQRLDGEREGTRGWIRAGEEAEGGDKWSEEEKEEEGQVFEVRQTEGKKITEEKREEGDKDEEGRLNVN